MRFALIVPPSAFLLDDHVMPPLGVLYLSAALKRQGHDVEVYDLSGGKSLPPSVDQADVFGISFTTSQVRQADLIAKYLHYAYPTKQIVAGGPHPTVASDDCKGRHYDCIIRGEGENFARVINKGHTIMSMPEIRDIDTIPYPDRKAVNIKSYKYKIDEKPAATIVSSRGCPYACAFCSRLSKKLRLRSITNIIGEIQEIKSLGFQALMFFDDMLTVSKRRTKELMPALKRVGMIYRGFVRANHFDDETAALMAEAGFKEVGFGAESGSAKILEIVNKKTTPKQNTDVVKLAHKHGMRAKAFLIVGLPGENHETVKETKRWIETAKPDDFDISIYQPYPGSKIADRPGDYDIVFTGYGGFFKGRPGIYKTNTSTAALSSKEILVYRDEIEKEYKCHSTTPQTS